MSSKLVSVKFLLILSIKIAVNISTWKTNVRGCAKERVWVYNFHKSWVTVCVNWSSNISLENIQRTYHELWLNDEPISDHQITKGGTYLQLNLWRTPWLFPKHLAAVFGQQARRLCQDEEGLSVISGAPRC